MFLSISYLPGPQKDLVKLFYSIFAIDWALGSLDGLMTGILDFVFQEAAWVSCDSYLPGPGLRDFTSGYCLSFPNEYLGFYFSRMFLFPLKSSGIVVYCAGDGPLNLLSRPLAKDISSNRCLTSSVS